MGRPVLYLVSEDYQLIEETRDFYRHKDIDLKVFSPSDWKKSFKETLDLSLSTGSAVVEAPSNVIPFPSSSNSFSKTVKTINELESIAIEKAIFEFKGNLTEAAKALGIGRATLYRKVKLYKLNPSLARKKKAA